MTDPLMSRDEVAELLGIKPNSVRDTLRRYGIRELRGYPRDQVENLERPGRGARTDLHMSTDPTTFKWQLRKQAVDAEMRTDLKRHDFSTALRVRNLATGVVYVRAPGSDVWAAPGGEVTTAQLEAFPEMAAEDD